MLDMYQYMTALLTFNTLPPCKPTLIQAMGASLAFTFSHPVCQSDVSSNYVCMYASQVEVQYMALCVCEMGPA